MNESTYRKLWLIPLQSILAIFYLGYVYAAQTPNLPDAPKPASVASGAPQNQASAFADIVASTDRNTRLAGWLGVYDALSVPVINQNGMPIGSTGDDPIGPRFWQLWYASGLDRPGRGIRLSDAARLIAVGAQQQDANMLGSILLKDLREALQSNDRRVRFLAEFVRERVRRGSSHVDLLTPEVTPDTAMIDLPTVQLLGWVTLRGALLQSVAPKSSKRSHSGFGDYRVQTVAETNFNLGPPNLGPPSPETTLYRGLPPSPGPPNPQTPCSEVLGNSDVTYWFNWLMREVAARGVQIPGMENEIPGWIERAQRWLGMGDDKIEKTKKTGALLNAFTAAISFAMQLSALDIATWQEPDPLVRPHNTQDGKPGKINWKLASYPSVDGNNEAICFISFVTNALGLSFSFPPEGRIAGAELKFEGGVGFPELVLFETYRDASPMTTNANGEVVIGVFGRAQKRELGNDAKPVRKEFSVIVRAQPEAVDGNTIANIFFSSLAVTAGRQTDLVAAITPIIDILKTFHWDLGEHFFELRDWQKPEYTLKVRVKNMNALIHSEWKGQAQVSLRDNDEDSAYAVNINIPGFLEWRQSVGGCTGSGSQSWPVELSGAYFPEQQFLAVLSIVSNEIPVWCRWPDDIGPRRAPMAMHWFTLGPESATVGVDGLEKTVRDTRPGPDSWEIGLQLVPIDD